MVKSSPVLIISRTDNIGDVVLTLPLCGALLKKYHGAKILFLAKDYVRPILDACEHINSFISWDNLKSLKGNEQVDFLRDIHADAIIHVFPNPEVARLAYKAKIPLRIGTSHRAYHWLYCNKLPSFTRKNSPLHEAQLNFKLAAPLGISSIPSLDELKTAYGLTRIPPLNDKSILDSGKFNLILHPKSRGSAREWDWDNWNHLANLLPAGQFKLFVTGTEEEGKEIRKNLLASHPGITDLTGKFNLSELIAFIASADGLVAASTGPLHIAAALGKKAIGLFPPIKPMHPGRWAPLGLNASYLVLDKNCSECRKKNYCACINAIKPEQVQQLLQN